MLDPVDPHLQQLRLKAEERLHKLVDSNHKDKQGVEILHELRVYQAELELQNQQLRETQHDLQQTLDRFNALYHRSPIGYVTIDSSGQIMELNDSFASMLGHPASNLRHKYLASYCRNDSAEVLRQRLPAFYKSPQGKILDLSLINNAGETLLVEVQGQKLPGEESLACSVIDRTKRKQAEEARKDSEAQLRAITSAARNAILMINSSGLVTYCNPACERVLGFSPSELLGQQLHELLAPEHYLPDYQRNFEQFRRDGKGNAVNKTVELTARHKSGKILDIELSLSAVAIKGEWHGVGIIRDITKSNNMARELARKQQEVEKNLQHLAREKQFSEETLKSLPGVFYMFDESGAFVHWNELFRTTTGYTDDELASMTGLDFFEGEDRQRIATAMQRVFVDGGAHVEANLCHRNKECTPYHFSGIRAIIGSRPYLLGVGLDITAQKKIEGALRQRTAELERFNYTVSHDLKSPLVTIKTFLGFLEQDLHNGEEDKVSQDIFHIRTAADRMNLLLEDLLNLSRLGWITDQPETLSLRALLEHALILVQGQVQQSGARISLPDTEIILYADPSRLLEIWQNLIDNALKYGINSEVPHIVIGVEFTPEPLFFIYDNGPGIAPEYHEKIFGLFEKLDRNSTGSGLGLALVKRIVEKHGGKIWVESSGKGQGCCFKFTLPAAFNNQTISEG